MERRKVRSIVSLGFLMAAALVFLTADIVPAQQDRRITRKKERRVALVIGNGSYKSISPLRNPVNDAKAMSDTLRRLGFKVMKGENLSQAKMKRAIKAFGRKIRGGGVGLFYYAGHGVRVAGRNYLIPIGADIEQEEDVEIEAVDMRRVLAEMAKAEDSLNIVILDACRNNPFARGFRSASNGLASMNAPSGTIIAYATAPGSVASDGPGDHGLYTQSLIKNMSFRGLKIEDVFKRTRVAVKKATGGKQVPWESSSLEGDFIFFAGGSMVVEPPEEETTPGKKGSLRVKTVPRGAEVFVDGTRKGRAPVTLTGLPPGKVKVKASLKGYRAQEETVYVRAGRETSLSLVLDRVVSTGTVVVRSDPSGAKWYLAGAYAGETPDEMKDVKPGSYSVQVKKQGYRDWSGTVTVRAGKRREVQANLKPVAAQGAGRPGEVWREPVTGMEFVWVPGGCYEMGCGSWTSDCYDAEKPVHEVCVDGFWIGKYEVTQGQWKKVMGTNPSRFKKGDRYPVEQVSWNDAKEFTKKLNRRSGGGYALRLPTEAEWEYACRGGGKAEKYAGGSSVDEVAWYGSNSGSHTHEVGTKAPNRLDIYDMSGNIYEWCEDIYSKDAYRKHQRKNPIYTSGGSGRVIRGGSWFSGPRYVRCADRGGLIPDFIFYSLGFRLVRPVK